jgi:hypothetical protein
MEYLLPILTFLVIIYVIVWGNLKHNADEKKYKEKVITGKKQLEQFYADALANGTMVNTDFNSYCNSTYPSKEDFIKAIKYNSDYKNLINISRKYDINNLISHDPYFYKLSYRPIPGSQIEKLKNFQKSFSPFYDKEFLEIRRDDLIKYLKLFLSGGENTFFKSHQEKEYTVNSNLSTKKLFYADPNIKATNLYISRNLGNILNQNEDKKDMCLIVRLEIIRALLMYFKALEPLEVERIKIEKEKLINPLNFIKFEIDERNGQLPGVYLIYNDKTSEFYIGSSINMYKRVRQHFYELKNRNHHSYKFQDAFNKHNESVFKPFVLYLLPDSKINSLDYSLDQKLKFNLLNEEQQRLNQFRPKYNVYQDVYEYRKRFHEY